MPVRDKLESWIIGTPKHLVAALFSLAGAGIVLVLVVLFIVAPQIAAIPNEVDAKPKPGPTASEPSKSRLLVAVTGHTFQTNSTLNMGIIPKADLQSLSEPKTAPHESPNKSADNALKKAELNLEGLDKLTFPAAFTSLDWKVEEKLFTPPPTPVSPSPEVPATTPAPETKPETAPSPTAVPSTAPETQPVPATTAEPGITSTSEQSAATIFLPAATTPDPHPTSTPTRRRPLPAAKKTPKPIQIEAGDQVDFEGMENFFEDLTQANFSRMQHSCWTITPAVFADRYTTKPAQVALTQALESKPKVTDKGVTWQGKHVDVSVTWAELSTRYSCPTVAYNGKVDAVSVDDVSYLMTRLMARSTTPVSPGDIESYYPLVCSHWDPPKELVEFSPKSREKLTLEADNKVSEEVFKILQSIQGKSIELYAVKNEYPMYLRASESQLKEPSAYFFRDTDGTLCIGSVVGKS